MDNTQNFVIFRHNQRRATLVSDFLDHPVTVVGECSSGRLHIVTDRIRRPFTDFKPVIVHAAHTCGRSERAKNHAPVLQCPAPQSKLFFCKYHNASALRRLVSEGGKLCCIGKLSWVGSVHRNEVTGLSIAQRDCAGFVQHQNINISGCFNGSAAHSKHIGLIETAHSRNTDCGKQRADGGGREADQQRH